MQHKTRLLIGKVIWKGRDLLSDASGLKRNLLRKPHMADLIGDLLSCAIEIYSFISAVNAQDHNARFHFTSRSPVNAILYAARKRFDVDTRLQPPLVVRRVYNLSCHVKRTRLFVKAAIINQLSCTAEVQLLKRWFNYVGSLRGNYPAPVRSVIAQKTKLQSYLWTEDDINGQSSHLDALAEQCRLTTR